MISKMHLLIQNREFCFFRQLRCFPNPKEGVPHLLRFYNRCNGIRRIALALAATSFVVTPVPGFAQDVLRVAQQYEPGTTNPITESGEADWEADVLLFDGLIRSDERGALMPDLATRVPTQQNGDISRDGRRITYHLVRNARWQDGRPVTADDVRFTVDATMDKRNNAFQEPDDEIDRLDTPDPYTVVIHLKHASASFVSNAFERGIAPAHLLRNSSDINRDPFGSKPVGSGPYRLISWSRGREMVFEANAAYFRGAPKIKRIVWRFMPNENTIINALRAHEVDFTDRLGITAYMQLKGSPGLAEAIGPSMTWEEMAFNTARGPLRDVRVRQALCAGTNLEVLYTKVYRGIGDLGVGFQHPRSPWYNRALQACRFDPNRARALLERAGWHMGADGIRVKGSQRLQITFGTMSGNITRQQTQVFLQSDWRDIGIDTVVRSFERSTYLAPLDSGGVIGKLDIAMNSITIWSEDPDRSFLDSPGPDDLASWHNARIDALEARGERTYDPVARKRVYDEIQRIEAEEVPYVGLRWWSVAAMFDKRLHGVRIPLLSSTYWNVQDWTY